MRAAHVRGPRPRGHRRRIGFVGRARFRRRGERRARHTRKTSRRRSTRPHGASRATRPRIPGRRSGPAERTSAADADDDSRSRNCGANGTAKDPSASFPLDGTTRDARARLPRPAVRARGGGAETTAATDDDDDVSVPSERIAREGGAGGELRVFLASDGGEGGRGGGESRGEGGEDGEGDGREDGDGAREGVAGCGEASGTGRRVEGAGRRRGGEQTIASNF